MKRLLKPPKEKKIKIETDRRRSAAIDLVEAFLTYKEATGENEIKLYDCRDWGSNGPTRVDATVKIDQLFVDDNGDICHNVLF